MELIPYIEFGKLRMNQLVPGSNPSLSHGVTFAEGDWIEECFYRATSLYRREDTPDETRGLTVGVEDLPPERVIAIFEAIHLPLRPGMPLNEVRAVLGEVEKEESYINGNKGCSFTVGTQHPYGVHVIVDPNEALIYVAIIRRDVSSKCRD